MNGSWSWIVMSVVIPIGAAAQDAPPKPAATDPESEVLILGTCHAPALFLSPGCTPAHIRALLANAKPDVIAIESPPVWFAQGRIPVDLYEAWGVAVPFARANGVPVHGVDWKDVAAFDRMLERRALADVAHLRTFLADGGPFPWISFGDLPRDSLPDLRWIDANLSGVELAHLHGIGSQFFAEMVTTGRSPTDPDFATRRDQLIADRCVEVMRRHCGKRLAVVIGAGHRPFLETILARRKGVRVLKAGADVPLPGRDEVDRTWHADDLIAILGHHLDAGHRYFHPEMSDLAYLGRLLERLESERSRPAVVRYFRARLLAAEGKAAESEAALDRLLDEGVEGDAYPCPLDEWRMRFSLSEAVRLEKARILIARGAADEARPHLDRLEAALAFRVSLALKTQPRELRRAGAVRDSGFEIGGRALDSSEGWAAEPQEGQGRLLISGDTGHKTEGEGSLLVEIVEANPGGQGFRLRQVVDVPHGTLKGEVQFGLAACAEGVSAARLEARAQGSAPDRKPLAMAPIAFEAGRFSRTEIRFTRPERGRFTIDIVFDGPAGARLWLDDATPLMTEYMTEPRDLANLVRAREFPRALRERQHGSGLIDPGFERGALTETPARGWSCDAGPEVVTAAWDPEVKSEGGRALRLDMGEFVRPGLPIALSQVVSVDPPPGGGEVRFSIALRGASLQCVVLELAWNSHGGTPGGCAREAVTVADGAWSRHQVQGRVAAPAWVVISISLPGVPGTTLWLDDARLETQGGR